MSWILLLALALPWSAVPAQAPGGPAGAAPPPREIELTSGDVRLAGSLRVPTGPPPHPGVVLLSGSLPSARDDARMVAVALAFVRAGFAVLTTDSRGHGGSQGDFDLASIDQLADDAANAVAALRRQPEVRADAVGLWGRSQGATWVGPLAATRAGAAFLIAASGPLDSPETHTHRFLAARLRSRGFPEEAVARAEAVRAEVWDYYATGVGYEAAAAAVVAAKDEPWFGAAGLPATVRGPSELDALPARTRTFLAGKDLDPMASLRRLPCPLLAVYGGADETLPVAHNAEALRALAARDLAEIEVLVAPSLDHDLRSPAASTATPGPDPEVLATMTRWAIDQVGRPPVSE